MDTTSTYMITVDDFLGVDDHELYATDLNESIAAFQADISEAQLDDGEPDPDDVAAHEQLVAFRDEVERLTGNHFDSATIVPDEHFEDFARGWGEEAYDVTADGIGDYVDWGRFADDLKGQYQQVDFGDDLVWVKG